MQDSIHSPKGFDPPPLGRRDLLAYTAAVGSAIMATPGVAQAVGDAPKQKALTKASRPPKRYEMKKSINLWAFPFPQQWSLKECFQIAKDAGFDGIEINFDETGEFSA